MRHGEIHRVVLSFAASSEIVCFDKTSKCQYDRDSCLAKKCAATGANSRPLPHSKCFAALAKRTARCPEGQRGFFMALWRSIEQFPNGHCTVFFNRAWDPEDHAPLILNKSMCSVAMHNKQSYLLHLRNGSVCSLAVQSAARGSPCTFPFHAKIIQKSQSRPLQCHPCG